MKEINEKKRNKGKNKTYLMKEKQRERMNE